MWSIIGAIVISTISVSLIVKSCNKLEVGYYLSTNDLYLMEGYDTVYIECFNAQNHKSVLEPEISSSDSIDLIGWSGNNYAIKYSSLSASAYFTITLRDKKSNVLIDNEKVYLHTSDEQKKVFDEGGIYEVISNLSFHFYGTNKTSGNVLNSGCVTPYAGSGTAWIAKHLDDEDIYFDDTGSDYQYYLMTNWHVELMFEEIKPKSYWWGNEYGMYKFTHCIPIEHGYTNENKAIGTDTFLYYVDFGDVVDTREKNRLNQINTICDENGDYPLKLRSDALALEDELFIGGYPKNASYDYTFVPCRTNVIQGYEGENWNKPIEFETISHFMQTKKYWSVANDVLMKPTVCDPLSGGSSGSLVLDNESNLVGIYWGGRTIAGTDAYCGNIETLYRITSENGELSDFSLSQGSVFPLFSYLNFPIES